jgi:transposase
VEGLPLLFWQIHITHVTLERWHEALPFEKGTQDRNNQKQYHILSVGEKDCQKELLIRLCPAGAVTAIVLTKTRI